MTGTCTRVSAAGLMAVAGAVFLLGAAPEARSQVPTSKVASASHSAAKPPAKPVARVNSVTVTGASGIVDVEIAASQSLPMRSQVATAPDRLILDFPNALPGSDLRNQAINRGEVKGIRVGLFAQNPPVTRVVVDLKSAQPYRIYPSGKTVIVKLLTGEQQAAARANPGSLFNPVSYTPPPPPPVLAVEYKNGLLSIQAERVSLAQVLSEIQRKTGAEIPIPSMAAQEQVVLGIGLTPIKEALTALLNGSRFNFIIVGGDRDSSQVKSVILTFRGGGGTSQPMIAPPPPPVTEGQPEPQYEAPQEVQPQPEVQPVPQDGQGQGEPPAPQPQENNPPQDTPPPQ